MTNNIKILVSYHDNYKLIKSEIVTPIQTGCANAAKLFPGMLRDNDGENISDKNDRYCELSAQYWAWKNYDKIGNPDYVGFMHYRRHFMFDGWCGNPDYRWLPDGAVYCVPFITDEYLKHISDNNIRKCINNVDCIVIKPYDVKDCGSKDIRTQFCKLQEQEAAHFDLFIKTAKKLAPEYLREIDMIKKGSVQYLCNMFVMRRDLFMEYSEMCFKILDAVDKQIDSSKMSKMKMRFLGYFGEFLLSVYIFNLQKRKNIKVKELNATFIQYDGITFKMRLTYIRYCILSVIWFGHRHKYRAKRDNFKRIIQGRVWTPAVLLYAICV